LPPKGASCARNLSRRVTDEAAYNLTIEDHAGRRTVLNLDLQAGDATIGRLEDNAVQLDERNVSRRHARLGLSSGQVIVEDLDSYNGLWVNGERISGSHPLQPGDALRVGDFELSMRPARPAPDAPNVPDVPEPTQRLFVPGALQPLDDVTQPGVHPEPVAEPTSVVRLPLDKFSEVPPLPPSSAALIP
jgi:pSer/pThr/pTyr-binding forkhead associated (FHA) protein